MRVLVTGGAGFIGSHAVDALIDQGADVICIDSLDPTVHPSEPAYLNPKVDYWFTDLRTLDCDADFGAVDAVVHFAALGGVARASREPANVVDGNVTGTARLCEAMARWPSLRRVILASSFSVYGASYVYRCLNCGRERDGGRRVEDLEQGIYEVRCHSCGENTEVLPLTADAVPAPLELYGATKFMQELCFRGFDRSPVSIVRQSSVYGPRLRLDDGEATIIARIAGWIRSGQSPTLLEDGRQIRDWVHVDDVVSAVLALIEGASAPPVVNACTGVPTGLVDACRALAAAMGSTCEPEIVGGYRLGDMRHCLGDPTAFAALLGRPPLSFSQGAERFFDGDSTTAVQRIKQAPA